MKTFFVILTVLFLFGGMVLIGLNIKDKADSKNNGSEKAVVVNASNSAPYQNEYSMKQIDSITSALNYNFTKANAKGLNPNFMARK